MAFKNSISFPQEKKQQTLLIVFIVIVIVAFVIIYFGFFNFSPSPSSVSIEIESDLLLTSKNISSIEKVIKKIDFNISFLKKSSFQDLKIYSEWPLKIDSKGKKNPFSLY